MFYPKVTHKDSRRIILLACLCLLLSLGAFAAAFEGDGGGI